VTARLALVDGGTVPPHDLDAERSVLGGALLAPEALDLPAVAALTPEEFWHPAHGFILEGMRTVVGRNEPLDAITLGAELQARGRINTVGGHQYLGDLTDTIPTIAHIETHARRVAALARDRAAATAARQVTDALATGDHDAAALAASTAVEATAAGGTWPEPIPLDAPGGVPAWPAGVLAGACGAFVEQLAAATETPRDLAAVLTLGALAAACRGRFVVQVKPGYREPTCLYLAGVLQPSERKSEVFRHVVAPLAEWERDAAKRERAAADAWASERRIAEVRLKKAEDLVARASVSELAEATVTRDTALRKLAELDAAPRVVPRLLADDVTPEAIASLLAEQGGALAIMSAEGGGLFDVMAGKYSAAPNLDVFLKGHSGDTLRVHRVKRAAEFVSRPALTTVLALQPQALTVLNARPELRGRGLTARFLFVVPPPCIGSRDFDEGRALDPATARAYATLVRRLLDLGPTAGAAGEQLEPAVLAFGPDARAAWLAFARRHEPRMSEAKGGDLAELADWAGKLAGAVARIAGLLHLADALDAAAGDGDLSRVTEPIGADAVARAVGLAEYFVAHARAAFGAMEETPAIATARRVLKWMRRRRKPVFTARDAHRGIGGRGRREDVIDPALEVLEAHGYVLPVAAPDEAPPPVTNTSKKGGRPKGAHFRANPRGL
jgi:replicative DNA helicase